MSELTPEALAGVLAADAGLPAPVSVERLAGGKNNRVFRVTLEDGGTVVLKSYHRDARDTRDRLAAEWSFLGYVWARGVRNVPRPLAALPAEHAGLYGFVAGGRAAEVTPALVDAAAAFIAAINGEPRQPEALAPGSEACFSIADHLATVARRIERLAALDEAAPRVEVARHFISGALAPAWKRVTDRLLDAALRRGLALEQPVDSIVISPSDFGFHNALAEAGQVAFIDFEYAGRDDPAKLVGDFFSQPEVPVPLDYYADFVARIGEELALSEKDLWRCDALLDLYRVKWVCIILNEFLPLGASRRAFADASDRGERAERQLARAERQFSLITI